MISFKKAEDYHITLFFTCKVSQADIFPVFWHYYFILFCYSLFNIAIYWDNKHKSHQQFLETYQIQKHHTISGPYLTYLAVKGSK